MKNLHGADEVSAEHRNGERSQGSLPHHGHSEETDEDEEYEAWSHQRSRVSAIACHARVQAAGGEGGTEQQRHEQRKHHQRPAAFSVSELPKDTHLDARKAGCIPGVGELSRHLAILTAWWRDALSQ